MIVTSNLHPSGFDSIMPKTIATAAVDRLPHHARIVLTEAPATASSRAATGRGVRPLQQSQEHRGSGQPRKTCHVVDEASSRVAQ